MLSDPEFNIRKNDINSAYWQLRELTNDIASVLNNKEDYELNNPVIMDRLRALYKNESLLLEEFTRLRSLVNYFKERGVIPINLIEGEDRNGKREEKTTEKTTG